jgi:bifunctional ADP-heptose synthase (sugar kinase/adenylyltransferase)
MPASEALDDDFVEAVLARAPGLSVGVLGDLFLDRYLDVDATLTEPSLETGLDAYQVVRVRPYPGAAGTVINNLAALGVGRVVPVAVLGDDGEGYELRRALAALGVVDLEHVFTWEARRTPTYTKPMLFRPGEPGRELNRLDIQNRTPLPGAAEERVGEALEWVFARVDALVVLDQVRDADCGVVTEGVRDRLAQLAGRHPDAFVLADSRERVGRFRGVCLKPNERECVGSVLGPGAAVGAGELPALVAALAQRAGRPVFCTRGERGIWLADPRGGGEVREVPGYPVSGPVDPVGAGDSTSAGIACARAAGGSLEQSAAFGNLMASVTVGQLGTTGTATPAQVRQRWREVRGR